MAKQGINPLEQHVEKIVVGLAALLFALVVFNYVISTPVRVNVSNRMISPGELDRSLGEVAQQVADVYKRAVWVPPAVEKPDTAGPLDDMKRIQEQMAKQPPPMASPVYWGVDVPKPKGGPDLEGKHGLATVGAPIIDSVFSGVTYAGLVDQPSILGDSAAGNTATASVATTNQDVVWAFLRLNFDMQEQYEIFRQNNYNREQANLMLFLEIQVQRQRVFPDGSPGPWEDVQPYRTVRAIYPQTVDVRDGVLAYGDDQNMRALFNNLVPEQTRILYPLPTILSPASDPFPPYYANGVPPAPITDATSLPVPVVPKPQPVRQPVRSPARSPGGGGGDMRPGSGGDMRPGSGSDMRPGSASGGQFRPGRPAGPGATPSAAPADKTALMEANKALRDATKAYEEKRYLEARTILNGMPHLPAVQRQVTELQLKVDADYAKWQESEGKLAAKKASDEARNTEIWVYDMQAPAGKACRYRARVLLLNVYAHPDSDRISELKNPQDGAQVALVGAWSAPSEPITLADSRHFFFTGGTADKELARVEVFRFQQGRWFKDTQLNVAIGDTIGDVKPVSVGGSRIDVDYRTGFVVVDIGTDPAAAVGSDKGSKVGIKRQISPVLVSMDPDGAIEPHWVAVDRINPLYKELDAKLKAAADTPLPSTAATDLAR
jgi:hypothetical protein